jgi:hypothetical protein
MKTRLLVVPFLLALLAGCGSGTIDRSDFDPTPDAGIDPVVDPCEPVREWCDAPFTWADDTTDRCYCPCTDHMVCEAAPVESKCGVLLKPANGTNGANPYVRFFPEGFPYVCRTAETTVP